MKYYWEFLKKQKKIIIFLVVLWYNYIKLLFKLGVDKIKRINLKRKKWLENRSRKIQNRIRKRNLKAKREKFKKNKINNKRVYLAPQVFSIVNNTKESSRYINRIMNKIADKRIGQAFYFDLSMVTDITCDAIMYMIAIMNNVKYKKVLKYSFYGNKPKTEEARNLFNESGFLKYVDSNEKNIFRCSNKIQIISGNKVDTKVVADICDFVNKSCNTKNKFTKKLYAMIIELMTNTVQHAYNKNGLFDNYWYIFVEDRENIIKFVFLDIGEGIASTVKMKIMEKILKDKSDSELICSAFKGEGRTETGESHRGKGLPDIAQECINGRIENLQVYSGKGICKIINGKYENYDLEEKYEEIYGSLFTWDINKKNIKEEFKIDGN